MKSKNKSTTIKLEQKKHKIQYIDELIELGELRKQISLLQNKNQDFETKMVDLVRDRDVAKESERRVRRGLYRVATGRMKIAEVLKVRANAPFVPTFLFCCYCKFSSI